jgi:hypothetical protein
MAGSFGFHEENYEVAQACGERVLLPEVRKADPRTMSSPTASPAASQIAQATGRRPLHLAQVLRMALREATAADGRLQQEP